MIFSEIDFQSLNESICELFEAYPGNSDTHISFQWNRLSPYFSDVKLLTSIYQNLLENGIKYRDPSKKSTLDIITDSTEKKCTLVFADNGIGIQKKVKVSVEKLKGNKYFFWDYFMMKCYCINLTKLFNH